jgi:hypothetical protein
MIGRPSTRHAAEPWGSDAGDGLPLDPLDRLLLRELSRPVQTPDCTAAVLARLGYAPASRRQRAMRMMATWVSRAALATAAAVAIGVGLQVHWHSPLSLRPSGPTLPAALEQDLRRFERRGSDMIERIRLLSPPVVVPLHQHHLDEQIDRSGAAPFCWV